MDEKTEWARRWCRAARAAFSRCVMHAGPEQRSIRAFFGRAPTSHDPEPPRSNAGDASDARRAPTSPPVASDGGGGDGFIDSRGGGAHGKTPAAVAQKEPAGRIASDDAVERVRPNASTSPAWQSERRQQASSHRAAPRVYRRRRRLEEHVEPGGRHGNGRKDGTAGAEGVEEAEVDVEVSERGDGGNASTKRKGSGVDVDGADEALIVKRPRLSAAGQPASGGSGRHRENAWKRSAAEGRKEEDAAGGRGGGDVPRAPRGSSTMKQLYLDLGQKNFGHVRCPTCGLLYARGEAEDERVHADFHARAVAETGVVVNRENGDTSGRRPGGSTSAGPDTTVVGGGIPCPKAWGLETAAWTHRTDPGRWVMTTTAGDHPARWSKAKAIAATVEEALGLPPDWLLRAKGVRAFVYVVAQRGERSGRKKDVGAAGDLVVGALFAEPIRRARRTLPARVDAAERASRGDGGGGDVPETEDVEETVDDADVCAQSAPAARSPRARSTARASPAGPERNGALWANSAVERATCGVRGVWVHPGHRRTGVATAMLTAARQSLIPGYVAGASEVAFTQPTEAGRALALSACGGGTGTFLVY